MPRVEKLAMLIGDDGLEECKLGCLNEQTIQEIELLFLYDCYIEIEDNA